MVGSRVVGNRSLLLSISGPDSRQVDSSGALVLLVDAFDSVLVTLSAIVIIGREIVVGALRVDV